MNTYVDCFLDSTEVNKLSYTGWDGNVGNDVAMRDKDADTNAWDQSSFLATTSTFAHGNQTDSLLSERFNFSRTT